MKHFILILSLSILMMGSLAFGSLKLGDPMPNLSGPTLNGKEFSVDAQKGKILIIHFWATWCPACREEMPLLSHFYELHHLNNLEMLGVSIDRSKDRKEVLKLIPHFSFPQVMLHEMKTNGFMDPEELPLTYLIDKKGMIRAIFKPGGQELNNKSLDEAVTKYGL